MSELVFLSLGVSLKVSLMASFLVMLLSILLAPFLLRSRSFFMRFFELFCYVPMIVPPVALGYLLLIFLGPSSFLGSLAQSLGIELAFSYWGAVLSSFFASLGIGIRGLKNSLHALKPDFRLMAEILGASSWQTYFYIELPLIIPSIIGTSLLVFMRSLSEFGASLIFAGNIPGSTRTLALAMWTEMQVPEAQALYVLILVSCSLAFMLLLLSEYFLGRTDKF